uniref:Long-chain-fatty-acid--CoA ligase n=1 Tax=Ascaris suum TaxID=6253 RepID=F1KYL1_ASCSU
MDSTLNDVSDQNANDDHIVIMLAALTVCITVFWWFWSTSPRKLKVTVDLNNQTKELPDGSRVAAFVNNGHLREYLFEDARTLYQGVRRGLRESNNGPMLGYRKKKPNGSAPYVWLSYQEVIDRSVHLSYGISAIGIKPGQQTFIGIYSKNRPEWVISELATYNNSCVIVALYDTLGVDARTFIIKQCGIQLVICDNEKKAASLIINGPQYPSLKFILVMDEYSATLTQMGKEVGVTVLPLIEIERLGRETTAKAALLVPKPDDLCTICYTSGTTGTPKGAMLTHANVIAASIALDHFPNSRTCAKDISISYLPLAHMYERLLHCIGYQVGARIGFFRGDVHLLIDDIKELHPTVIPLVPRVLHRFYDRVMAEVNKSIIKKLLFNIALCYKNIEVNRGIIRHDSLFDQLIFKDIRDELGGCVRFMMIGSAPVDGEVLRFARAALGCVIVEGYGQTECAAATTAVVEADPLTKHVGIPLACAAIKLVDVPELGYYVKDKAGEVCIRGAHVFKGYYKNDEITNEVLDADGWLHSGDIGKWTERDTLKIIDRKKHIFKLQQGEFICPDKIESIYDRSQYVLQTFVYGESLKTCLIAIVVPDEEAVLAAAKEKLSIKAAKVTEIYRNPDVKKMIFDDMIAIGRKEGLNSFEQVKDIFISCERFTVTNDLLTPTMKNKRANIKQYFAKQLAEMYSKLK